MVNIARWQRVGRWFMAAWALFALPSAVSDWQSNRDLVGVFEFIAWGVVWAWFWLRGLGRSRAAEVIGLAANAVLLTLFAVAAPASVGAGGVLVFVFIIAGVSFPVGVSVWLLGGLTALQLVLSLVRGEPPSALVSSLLNSILVGGIGIGGRLLWRSYTQLLSAREQLAHLAVTEERLRFARDLHDLLGQSLSVLVLKSEVVAKQLPDDADESLRQEVRDIAQVARKSLNDVRETVAGYRRPTLQTEISNARSALRAAGIGLLVRNDMDALPADQDGVLAWCLREAVTNVVKHSGATRCEVSLTKDNGSARLEVADDGRGASSLEDGSGLVGMRERVALVGGTLHVEAENGGGLHLQVTVPQTA